MTRRSIAPPQPELVTGVADPVDERPVQHAPEITERRVMPGPDVGRQARDPSTVCGFEVKPRQQPVLVEAGLGISEFVDIFEIQPAAGEAVELVDFRTANGACPVVVERIFIHAPVYARLAPADQRD